ncbi:hypothetical protein IZ6_20570 [Terrihabitans soli]|uniref:Mucoidy inhibitor MuiA family protein n=1 Tax=Terrihabitans soli TaxID=708113 RepID=A0A6S6QVN7_9HYPH|nr:mucoidy inhibitor MuiA family protein [Terrihabitans soli]BCJ91322.1 hypothetical protein IZ6_20570 [Terrihabitans soli]
MRLAAATLLAVSFAAPAFAAEIAVPSKIDTVAVHPRAATITRTLDAELKAGASTLVLKNIPAGVDVSSIRVEGTGENVKVLSSDFRTVPSEDRPLNPEQAKQIEALQREIARIEGEIEQATTLKTMVGRYAEAKPGDMKSEQQSFDVTQWRAAWDAVDERLKSIDQRLRASEAELEQKQEELARLEDAAPGGVPEGPQHEILVELEAASAARAYLRVSYQVQGASWRPAYEARLSTGKQPKLVLERRAIVTQTTGEDWSGVSLSVHTADTYGRTSAPDILAWRAGILDESDRYRAKVSARDQAFGGSLGEMQRAAPMAAPAEPEQADKPITAVSAEILNTGYTTSFVIPGRVSVTADGTQKTLLISKQDETPKLQIETAPAIAPTAYVQAAFNLTGETPLFPGQVALYRDGTLMGREKIGLTAPGDEVELGFGQDDRVRVEHVPVKTLEEGPRLLSDRRTETRSFKTIVTNFHDTPVSVRVMNRIPFSEQDKVEVTEIEATPKPTARNFKDVRGALAWDFDLQPNGKQDLTLAYSVSWPDDARVNYQDVTN